MSDESTDKAGAPDDAPAPKKKGHWRKGKSRNLEPGQIAAARTLVELLRRAIDKPYRHPTMGALDQKKVAAHLKVDPKTVYKWMKLVNRPPAWACDELRILLRDFSP